MPDKRNAILEATLKLIAEQGFHATPMSQIADRANIGVGTIYRYFPNKEQLLNALYIEIKRRMIGNIAAAVENDAPVKQKFVLYLTHFFQYCTAHPSDIQFTEQYENSPLITEETKKETKNITKPLERLFAEAAAEGVLKEMPFPVLITLFSGAVMALLKMYMPHTPDKQELHAAIEAIWDMICK